MYKRQLQYIVTDSWGRSNTAERIVNLKNGIFEDKIKFGLNDRLNLSFIKDTSDENSVKLNFTVNNSLEYFASSNSNFKYYGIKVYEPREGTTASSSKMCIRDSSDGVDNSLNLTEAVF